MGLGVGAVQNILELNNLGYFKNSKNVIEIGSQNLHLNIADLKDLYEIVGLDNNVEETHPDVKNWPFSPKCQSKYFWKAIGINDYECIDVDGENNAIVHDLNKPFEDKSKFNKFDIVTDFGSCEHVFNIGECYKTMHNLTKPDGYMIIAQATLKGNGYFKFDQSFFEGIAAANNYNVVYNSYLITTGSKTKNGSWNQFHIPRNEDLLNVMDYSKLSQSEKGSYINIYCVFQKTNENEFKIPYQGNITKDIYNIAGFNRAYLKETLNYNYIPSATVKLDDTSVVVIFRELYKWFKKKTKKIIRILIMKLK